MNPLFVVRVEGSMIALTPKVSGLLEQSLESKQFFEVKKNRHSRAGLGEITGIF
jgi:hypothetical protein